MDVIHDSGRLAISKFCASACINRVKAKFEALRKIVIDLSASEKS